MSYADHEYVPLGRDHVSRTDPDAEHVRVKLDGQWMNCVCHATAGLNGVVVYMANSEFLISETTKHGHVELFIRVPKDNGVRDYAAEHAWLLRGLRVAKDELAEADLLKTMAASKSFSEGDPVADWSAVNNPIITIADEPIDELFETKQRLSATEAILRGTEAAVDYLKGELAREKEEKAELQYRYDDLMSDFQERD